METLPKTWANAERVLPLRRCRRRRRPPVIWVSRAIAATAEQTFAAVPKRENDFILAVWAAPVDKKTPFSEKENGFCVSQFHERQCKPFYQTRPARVFSLIGASRVAFLPPRWVLPAPRRRGTKVAIFHASSKHFCLSTAELSDGS